VLSPPSARTRRTFEVALLALAGAALAFQLLLPPIVGLANNGDFSRVAEPLGIFPPEEIGAAAYFDWVVPQYRFDTSRLWFHGLCCYSSQTLFVILAVPVGVLISPPGGFDLRAIGIVNVLGFLAATWLLVLASRPLHPAPRAAAGLLFVHAFTDVSYATYFNSLYTEPAALIFFLASLALALLIAERPAPSGWLIAGFFLSAALLSTSRPQNALLGIPLAILGMRLAWPDHARSRRFLVTAAALTVCVVSVWYFRSTPGPLGRIHLYNAVFRELLPASDDPKRDLSELGLPPELARLAGGSGFSSTAPIADPRFRDMFYARVGYGKLARFYLSHPKKLWMAIERTAAHAFEIRPLRIGNYTRSAGKFAGARSGSFDLWSRAKERFAPTHPAFVIGYLAVNLAAAIAVRASARDRAAAGAAEIWIVVVLVAAFQFSVSAVMEHESRRSLFLFNASCDVLFLALTTRIVAALSRRAR
jgi:hypothetical protein